MSLLLNLGGLSLDLGGSGGGSQGEYHWNYRGDYDNGISYNTDDVVFYNGGLWHCFTSANLSAGYPPDSRPECWIQVSSTGGGNPFDQSLNVTDNPYFDSGGAGFETGGFFVNGAGITPGFGIYIGNDYTRSSNVNIRTDGNATFGKGAVNASDTGLFIQTTSGYAVIGDCYYGINASMLLDSNTGSGAFANSICVGGAGGGADFTTPTTAFKEDGTAFIGGGISFDGTTGTASFANGAATIDASGNAAVGVLSCGNSVSSTSDNTVDSKVEIVINGTTYYLLASTSAS